MKLLIWSPTGVGTHYSGPATSTFRLMTALKKQYPEVNLSLAHGSASQKDNELFGNIYQLPIVHEVGANRSSWYQKIRYLNQAYRLIKNLADRYDVVYMPVSNVFTLIPLIWLRSRGIPVVTRLAGNHELVNTSQFRRFIRFAQLRGWFIKRSQLVVAISNAIHTRLLQLGVPPEKILDLPNLVDSGKFFPADISLRNDRKVALGIPSSDFVVSIVGSICPRKNQESIIRALPDLSEDVHLILAGPFLNDQYKSQVEALVDELELDERITITGHLDEVVDIYQASDMYCLPSKAEGMPNSLLEAMSYGLPCVVTNIDGNNDLIDANGVRGLYTSGTPSSIASAIRTIYEDTELRSNYANEARNYIEANHSYIQKVPVLYKKIKALSELNRNMDIKQR